MGVAATPRWPGLRCFASASTRSGARHEKRGLKGTLEDHFSGKREYENVIQGTPCSLWLLQTLAITWGVDFSSLSGEWRPQDRILCGRLKTTEKGPAITLPS